MKPKRKRGKPYGGNPWYGVVCPAISPRFLDKVNAVKVISFWTGERRRDQPQGPEDSLKKLRFIMEKEMTLNYGAPMDLIIVNSINEEDNDSKVINYLNLLNGKRTKNGRVTVLHRDNYGISFGSFHYAFNLFKDNYEYWYFAEDDYITSVNNVLSTAIGILDNEKPKVGFVATCQVCPARGYARGGTGVTTRDIMLKAHGENLPFHSGEEQYSWRKHQELGERHFTNKILRKGWKVVELPIPKSMIFWGYDPKYEQKPDYERLWDTELSLRSVK